MKRKIALPLAAVVVVAAVVILAVYLRPRSFSDCMGFDPNEAAQLTVRLHPFDTDGQEDPQMYILTPDDPDYQALVERFDQHQYRPKFPAERNHGRTSDLDYMVNLYFSHDDDEVWVYFHGNEVLPYFGELSFVTIAGMDKGESIAFQQEILDLLLDAADRHETID